MKLVILVLTLLAVAGSAALFWRSTAQSGPADVWGETPTKITRGKLTAVQKAHSELYDRYKQASGSSLVERAANGEGVGPFVTTCVGIDESVPFTKFIRSLGAKSDAVVVGQVISKTSQLTEDETVIFTDYELHVDDVIKDNRRSPIPVGGSIVVSRFGGMVEVDGHTLISRSAAFAPLTPGEGQYLLFLEFLPETGTYRATSHEASFKLGPGGVSLTANIGLPESFPQTSIEFWRTTREIVGTEQLMPE